MERKHFVNAQMILAVALLCGLLSGAVGADVPLENWSYATGAPGDSCLDKFTRSSDEGAEDVCSLMSVEGSTACFNRSVGDPMLPEMQFGINLGHDEGALTQATFTFRKSGTIDYMNIRYDEAACSTEEPNGVISEPTGEQFVIGGALPVDDLHVFASPEEGDTFTITSCVASDEWKLAGGRVVFAIIPNVGANDAFLPVEVDVEYSSLASCDFCDGQCVGEQFDGNCMNLMNSFQCNCATGFSGRHCEVNVDDCIGVTDCGDHGTCVDGLDDFSCECDEGFTGGTCSDAACLDGEVYNIINETCDACGIARGRIDGLGNVCEVCPEGTYGTSETGGCQSCSAGRFQPLSNSTSCDLCPAGTYSFEEKSLECEPCGAGNYSIAGARECSRCGPGRKVNDDQSKCQKCPANSISDLESNTVCHPCGLGEAASLDQTTCITCSDGLVPNEAGSACVACPRYHIAKYNATVGPSCQRCPDNTEAVGSTECRACASTEWSLQGGPCVSSAPVSGQQCYPFLGGACEKWIPFGTPVLQSFQEQQERVGSIVAASSLSGNCRTSTGLRDVCSWLFQPCIQDETDKTMVTEAVRCRPVCESARATCTALGARFADLTCDVLPTATSDTHPCLGSDGARTRLVLKFRRQTASTAKWTTLQTKLATLAGVAQTQIQVHRVDTEKNVLYLDLVASEFGGATVNALKERLLKTIEDSDLNSLNIATVEVFQDDTTEPRDVHDGSVADDVVWPIFLGLAVVGLIVAGAIFIAIRRVYLTARETHSWSEEAAAEGLPSIASSSRARL